MTSSTRFASGFWIEGIGDAGEEQRKSDSGVLRATIANTEAQLTQPGLDPYQRQALEAKRAQAQAELAILGRQETCDDS